MKSVRKIPKSELPLPSKSATQVELIERLDSLADSIQTLNLTVLFELTASSAQADQIEDYRETKGFILAKKPNLIRIIGQAFNVTVFDMVSDGRSTSIFVPAKNRFYHLLNNQRIEKTKIPVGDLRPQHILQALAIERLETDAPEHPIVMEEDQEGRKRFYVLNVLKKLEQGGFSLSRKIWFDRFDLNVTRQKVFRNDGKVESDISYANFKEAERVPYPSEIVFRRPQEDYSLRIRVDKTRINEPLTDDKFVLAKPEDSELVDLANPSQMR